MHPGPTVPDDCTRNPLKAVENEMREHRDDHGEGAFLTYLSKNCTEREMATPKFLEML